MKGLVLCVAMLVSSVAFAQVFCSMTKHPGDVSLWIDSTISFESGNSLYNACNETHLYLKCIGYVAGVADVFAAQNTNTICKPKDVTLQQAADVVKKYLTDHPEERHYTAVSEISMALSQAFPCSAAK